MKPERSLLAYEGEDFSEYIICYPDEENVSERMMKNIFEVVDLLLDKMRFH